MARCPWSVVRIGGLIAALITLLVSCGEGGTAASRGPGAGGSGGSRPEIGVSLLTLSNPFFVAMKEAMEAKGAELGYDVVVVSGDLDPAKQQNQVDDFITRGVAAIVLCPADSKAIGTSVRKANESQIPVFTADIAVLAEGAEVVAHVATDNELGGRLAAEAMVEAIGGSGQVAIIDHPEVESVILRTKGFEERLAELSSGVGVDIEIVQKLPGKGAQEQSFAAMEAILQSHPGVAGVFAINDPSALGAVAALEKAGKLASVAVIGFDGAPEAMAALRQGKIRADVVQHPDEIGSRVIQAVADYANGMVVEAVQLIDPSVLTPETVAAGGG